MGKKKEKKKEALPFYEFKQLKWLAMVLRILPPLH